MFNDVQLKSAFNLLTKKMVSWYVVTIKSIPNIIVAILVFLLFVALARLAKNLTSRLIPRLTHNKALTGFLKTGLYFSVLTIGFFTSLEILNLEKTVTSLLAGAGVVGLALGFAFQEIASNFVSGVFIAIREPYKIDDIVKIDDYFGKIVRINLRTTIIETFDGLEVLIPNKSMFTQPLVNFTSTPYRRIDLDIGVSYSDDLSLVEKVTKKTLENLDERVQNRDAEVYFKSYGASSIDLSARFWINYPGDNNYLKAKHKAILEIKKAYDKHDITIPFPIRTLDFDKSLNVCLEQK